MNLARELVSRTRVSRLLKGYRDRPPADLEAILLTLIQVSQIIIDLPEVVELDVNPLLAGPGGVLALDAGMSVAPAPGDPIARLAIRPYPRELEETVTLRDGRTVLLRPIRPEDEPAHLELFESMTPEDVYYRFFNVIHRMSHTQLARFTQIDYDREMAFIATLTDEEGRPQTLGVVRAVGDPDNTSAEFAISVRSDLKRQGMGSILLDKIIRYCRGKGTGKLVGQVLPDNRPMLALAARHGFERERLPGDDVVELRLSL
jgi:acetyltransferase